MRANFIIEKIKPLIPRLGNNEALKLHLNKAILNANGDFKLAIKNIENIPDGNLPTPTRNLLNEFKNALKDIEQVVKTQEPTTQIKSENLASGDMDNLLKNISFLQNALKNSTKDTPRQLPTKKEVDSISEATTTANKSQAQNSIKGDGFVMSGNAVEPKSDLSVKISVDEWVKELAGINPNKQIIADLELLYEKHKELFSKPSEVFKLIKAVKENPTFFYTNNQPNIALIGSILENGKLGKIGIQKDFNGDNLQVKHATYSSNAKKENERLLKRNSYPVGSPTPTQLTFGKTAEPTANGAKALLGRTEKAVSGDALPPHLDADNISLTGRYSVGEKSHLTAFDRNIIPQNAKNEVKVPTQSTQINEQIAKQEPTPQKANEITQEPQANLAKDPLADAPSELYKAHRKAQLAKEPTQKATNEAQQLRKTEQLQTKEQAQKTSHQKRVDDLIATPKEQWSKEQKEFFDNLPSYKKDQILEAPKIKHDEEVFGKIPYNELSDRNQMRVIDEAKNSPKGKELQAQYDKLKAAKYTKAEGGKYPSGAQLAKITKAQNKIIAQREELINSYIKEYDEKVARNSKISSNEVAKTAENSTQKANKSQAETIEQPKWADKFKAKMTKMGQEYSDEKIANLANWHKDSHAVTKESDGSPKVFYHGTNANFDAFDINKLKGSWLGKSFYFTDTKKKAKGYGKNVMSIYLNIKNPYISKAIDNYGFVREVKEQFNVKENFGEFDPAQVLKEHGYDGVVYKDWNDDIGYIYTAFSPNQIKSISNNGAFNPRSKMMNAYTKVGLPIALVGGGLGYMGTQSIVDGYKNKDTTNQTRAKQYAKFLAEAKEIAQVAPNELYKAYTKAKKDLEKPTKKNPHLSDR